MASNNSAARIALGCVNALYSGDSLDSDIADIRKLAPGLGYVLADEICLVEPGPAPQPLNSVLRALRAAGAEALFVPDLRHLGATSRDIQMALSRRCLIVTVLGEHILDRATQEEGV